MTMKSNNFLEKTGERYQGLLTKNVLGEDEFRRAEESAFARGREFERILITEYSIPKRVLLQTLSEYYGLAALEYDERIPVPSDLFSGLDPERLSASRWFPVFREGDTIVIAANDPESPSVLLETAEAFPENQRVFMVALCEDIRWFIHDFSRNGSGEVVGIERTNLAYWRNTMSHWRTRLACYRTDLAKGRTGLNVMRWGFGAMALSDVFMRIHRLGEQSVLYWAVLAAGLSVVLAGLSVYLRVRKSRMQPPENQTLVEVTAAVLHFLEDFHCIENACGPSPSKSTMLGRLGDFLLSFSTILRPFPAYRERIHLARERDVLAAQRTIAACYRTIASRARTGLSFLRTGVSIAGLGIGFIKYFGLSVLTTVDIIFVAAGLLMIMDGAFWYWPVRKEQADSPRCTFEGQV